MSENATPPRSRAERRRDTEHRLAHDVDLWVASASADGAPYLVPLSFDWDGEDLLAATLADSPTGRNLTANGTVRLALGGTRDVTMIDGDVEVLALDALPRKRGDRFAARTGFDPRRSDTASGNASDNGSGNGSGNASAASPYRWFRITPRRVQAWREADEIQGRELMRDGHWLTD
ncbi:pyridoxamine 5'-phosphate oxidase family protein [Streptomyces sp. NPDC048370]|uniref:pyridoxamine 5'-phosphate oxidase family protein n=1 Tax=Streptomyces sp. NPDC048370 TaxID=3365540 RepID=UPI0037151824